MQLNLDPINALINHIIDENGGYEACSLPATDGSYRTINPSKVEGLADSVMLVLAELVATLIDAGSEREAVMESDVPRDAIIAELRAW